jgi:hypothetical protein
LSELNNKATFLEKLVKAMLLKMPGEEMKNQYR